jgi:hypothetical protein
VRGLHRDHIKSCPFELLSPVLLQSKREQYLVSKQMLEVNDANKILKDEIAQLKNRIGTLEKNTFQYNRIPQRMEIPKLATNIQKVSTKPVLSTALQNILPRPRVAIPKQRLSTLTRRRTFTQIQSTVPIRRGT